MAFWIRNSNDNPDIDQYHTVSEAPCFVDLEITASAMSFCPGETVTVTAPEGFISYYWSNGAGGFNEVLVHESINLSLLVYDADGCAGSSNVVSFVEIGGEEPTVDVSGSLTLCDGNTVVMTASDADSWEWSSGESTQTIEVTTGGTYSVSVIDICGNPGSSDEIVVDLYDSPSAPQ